MQIPITITGIKEEAPGVKTFTLEANEAVPYKAGQFLTLLFHHHGKEERRSFSIAASPAHGDPLSMTVKRVANGAYSRYLTDRVKTGDKFMTTGAAGLFTLPDNVADYNQLFFFAAGIGITPVYAVIKEALMTLSHLQLVLIYSNRNTEEIVFYKELTELQQQYPERLKIEFLLGNNFDLSRARLSKSLIPVLLKEYSTVPKEQQLFYTCGPYDYMRMVIYGLEEQKIESAQIKKENFDVSTPVLRMEPPDKEKHNVVLSIDGAEHTLAVQYPETILRAARNRGIQLPYSCDAGRCGSCVAKCTEGKVWMSVNEVLTDGHIAKGLVLTCTGYPVGGDVRIEI